MATPTGPAPVAPPTCFGLPATATDAFLNAEWRNPGTPLGPPPASPVDEASTSEDIMLEAADSFTENEDASSIFEEPVAGTHFEPEKQEIKELHCQQNANSSPEHQDLLVYVSLQRLIMSSRIYFLC